MPYWYNGAKLKLKSHSFIPSFIESSWCTAVWMLHRLENHKVKPKKLVCFITDIHIHIHIQLMYIPTLCVCAYTGHSLVILLASCTLRYLIALYKLLLFKSNTSVEICSWNAQQFCDFPFNNRRYECQSASPSFKLTPEMLHTHT